MDESGTGTNRQNDEFVAGAPVTDSRWLTFIWPLDTIILRAKQLLCIDDWATREQ